MSKAIKGEVRQCNYCSESYTVKHQSRNSKFCSRRCFGKGKPHKKPMPLEDRFWQNVDKGDGNGCWLWTGGRMHQYGAFKVPSGTADGTSRRAHRVAYELQIGPIPDGMCVCHRCDTPLCCRGDHLFLGTIADNNRDKEEKGRGNQPRGEANGNRRLTGDDVLAIRTLTAEGVSFREAARRFGTTKTNVGRIVRGEIWKHVGGPLRPPTKTPAVSSPQL